MRFAASIAVLLLAWHCSGQQSTARASATVGSTVKITVSAKGIANGKATIANDGKTYGPDTAGTTTSGIQEALNSLHTVTGYATNADAAEIYFGSGDFYYTNSITYSNTFISMLKLAGEGYLSSRLIYAGGETAPFDCFTVRGEGNTALGSLNIPCHVQVSDLCFMSITNATYGALLRLTNCSNERVRDCNFTLWYYTTNVAQGPGVSMFTANGAAGGSSVIGLKIGNVNDNQTIIEDCVFGGLAGGVDLLGDHVYAYNLVFSEIGHNNFSSYATLFPNTSVYSLGACIYRSVGLATYLDGLDMYSSAMGIVNDSANGINDIFINNIELEGTDNGWYGAFATNKTRVYLPSFSTSDELYTAQTLVTHSPYAVTGVQSKNLVTSRLWTANADTNTTVTRLLGVNQGHQFAAEMAPQLPLVLTNANAFTAALYPTNLVPVGVNPDADSRRNGYMQYFTTNNVVVINALTNVDTTGTKYFDFYFVVTNSAAADKAIILPNNVHTNIAGTVQRVTNITYVRFSGIGGLWTNGKVEPQW